MTDKAFYLKCFGEVKELLAPAQLEIVAGEYQNCVFLKLFKKTWANASLNVLTPPSRIFFSVWIAGDHSGILFYNIHALKLRQLKGYKIESRKFAETFRTAFRPFEHQWPNVSTRFGPHTLMQGQLPVVAGELKPAALLLCRNFMDIRHLIDETLAAFLS